VKKNKAATPDTTLHALFERQADQSPSDIALICGNERLSFRELDHRANQLARWLRRYGVGPGALVGIYLERSVNPFIAMLASLKAGAAYVTIDPNYPLERVRYMLTDAGITVLVTEQAFATQVASVMNGKTVLMDTFATLIQQQSTARLPASEVNVSPSDLCYVIYTSGSTGRPKGVMVEHRNVVNFVTAATDIYQIKSSDRVYQGFSLSFDGAIDEIWPAFAAGATLVAGTGDVVHSPRAVAQLLTEERITIFSTVPTFLSMIDEELPSVRVLIVGGEQCSADLVRRWAGPQRRMLNTYGPAETTVVATWAECAPDRLVSIGKPLPGVETYVLDEKLQPVPHGQVGELYIGGRGVARGYINQPELTAKHFLNNPNTHTETGQRLYRTGDRVRMTDDGNLLFIGRVDDQVKIRGYRVELSEIESVLREHPTVRTATVKVVETRGLQDIAAYIVVNNNSGEIDRNSVIDLLRTRLPRYMIPEYLDVLDQLPTLSSGKVDRSLLPSPVSPLLREGRSIVSPRTPLEQSIADVWMGLFEVSPISIKDDFFLDLGGHSLLAARLVAQLRETLGRPEIAVRNIYQHPTIERLSEHLVATAEDSADVEPEELEERSSQAVFASLSPLTRWFCVGLQALSLYFIYGLLTIPAIALVMLFVAASENAVSIDSAAWMFGALIAGLYPALLIISVLLKWVFIGRYKPGKYPVWGIYYWRWWLVTRIQALSGAGFLAGTPLMSVYYRLMGANVGKHCILDTSLCQAFDLVSIGDDTSIGAQSQLLGCRIEDGMLVVGNVDIGSRCFVGIHSAIGLNTRIEDDSHLDDLSLLPDGEVMNAGKSHRGSPAQPAPVKVPQPLEDKPARRHPLLFGLLHVLVIYFGQVFLLLTALPSLALILYAIYKWGLIWGFASALFAGPLGIISFCLGVAAVKSMVLGKVKPGVYRVESSFYLRKWFIDGLLNISRRLLLPLYATLYLPPWLRLLGAKLGARMEISTVSHVSPDLLVADDESFFADAALIGGMRIFRGHVQISVNRIGRRSFVGNSAMMPVGAELGNDCLLGCLSAPPASQRKIPDGSAWLGSPSFQLPHRQKLTGFDDSVLYKPTTSLYIQRLIIDALRIMIPSVLSTVATIAMFAALFATYGHLGLPAMLGLAPLVALGLAVGAALSVLLIKKVVMGKYKPTVKPLWSMFVWLNELINGAYESIAAPALSPMLGTPFYAAYMRLLGCKIGRGVYLGTSLFSEFDLVEIGDYAALNLGATIQTHLFEDRIMKASYLKIGNECSVGNMAVILYDTEMQPGSSVGPLSLLMKGETVPASSRWHGIPTGPNNVQNRRSSPQNHDEM